MMQPGSISTTPSEAPAPRRGARAAAAFGGLLIGGLLIVGSLLGCSETAGDPSLQGDIRFAPNRPKPAQVAQIAAYSGDNALVLEAQSTLATGLDLHSKVIQRTCGPTGGVCHNMKEYPALHTPANFLAAVGAPCNVQPLGPDAVYDRCERPGDRFLLAEGEREIEIGYLELVAGEPPADGATIDSATAGLHLYLAEAVKTDRESLWSAGSFVRSFVMDDGIVADLPFFTYDTRWWVLDEGKHLVGQVRQYQATQVEQLLLVGVEQGDLNRNGMFGAREGTPVSMIAPGSPEQSYLVARLRGTMDGEEVPGTRMPLANQPLSVPEMLALYCFIEGLAYVEGAASMASPIDYARCGYADDPENLNLLGSGVTWQARVSRVLEFNCGGCHGGSSPAADLSLKGDGVYARLLEPSGQNPELALIQPGSPEQSYLWLKLTADPEIMGASMPINPLTGEGRLSDAELEDIRSWIEAGAVENQ